jgi:amidase
VTRSRNMGQLRPPTVDDLRRAGARDHLDLSLEECETLAPFAAAMLELLDAVEELPDIEPPVHYRRDPGRRPTREEDPYNAFVRVLHIEGASSGPLSGKRVGVKDCLSVAGVPMTNGSRTFAYTPPVDAAVVERILDAGGTIVGTLNLDDFSSSGYGVTSVFGPPRNPLRPTHSAGGSSGGPAAAVAAGLVDVALGVDDGGSIRIPAAACGVVGLKATHGLVPSFGLTHMDHTLDHVGPLARSVREAAELLAVIAGEDWRDPQWVRGLTLDEELGRVDKGVAGLRIGVLEESLDDSTCEPAVLRGVEAAAEALRLSGAEVEQVSIPLWRTGFAIWLGVFLAGAAPMLRSNGLGSGHFGYVDVGRVHAAGLVRKHEGHLLPPTLKLALLLNGYLDERYQCVPLARAQNQRIALRRDLDRALERVDALLTPTVPRVACQLPEGRITEVDALSMMVAETVLTSPLNATGHPAVAVPSGVAEKGLPTSVQVIGRRWEDRRALAAAAAIEAQLGLKLHEA